MWDQKNQVTSQNDFQVFKLRSTMMISASVVCCIHNFIEDSIFTVKINVKIKPISGSVNQEQI